MAYGGQSAWDRQVAAKRREAERRAKEQEKARLAEHVARQQRSAEMRTAAIAEEIRTLDCLLLNALRRPAVTLDSLKVQPKPMPFQPGKLATARPSPDPQDYLPAEPRGLERLLGGMSRYREEAAAARARYERDVAEFHRVERQRERALHDAKAQHRRQTEAAEASAAAHNRKLDALGQAVAEGEAGAVEWFVDQVLKSSRYPESFPRRWQVAYRPENRDVVVEFELPPQGVVPSVREYRYVKTRDAIDPVARAVTEIRQRYARLIACVTLRTLHEIFHATPPAVVEAVVFNGRVDTIDRATGRRARPHLVSVEAERSAFAELVLADVEPAACLKHLNALVSPNPFDMEAVEPFIDFDLKRFRFVDETDELASLDYRRNLLKLTPTEFEVLVKDLFVAMGAEAWRTVPSKDGGVDAVATSKNLFFGGVCLIQAKRWTGLVGLDAVHALTGVMTDHNATTGVLVTTSWFSRTSEQFAQRNRITLINGAELKHLIKEHLGLDVVPGTKPPRRLNASDNRQTGKPGPT